MRAKTYLTFDVAILHIFLKSYSATLSKQL